ncbi:hypothetical protein KFK09_006198 [Dendrobium nobile]|uniref:BHLH domain-containing protein n=1 Tax=Dendrobium nobile TaxID=94219 RepID=A0A8T3BNN5_DENNO|nr:hypothetical protein KFK09_006198 [Dendrobium nobile]
MAGAVHGAMQMLPREAHNMAVRTTASCTNIKFQLMVSKNNIGKASSSPPTLACWYCVTGVVLEMRRRSSVSKGRTAGARRKRAVTSLVIRKLRKLKRIVPGCGRSSGADSLLRRTAAYISSLEDQVLLLESLCNLFGV